MPRGNDSWSAAPVAVAPLFDIRSRFNLPSLPILCILVPRPGRVEVILNEAHGDDGIMHASYHADQGLTQQTACMLGDGSCGYDPSWGPASMTSDADGDL
jgi:hypothetical protein